MSKVERPSGRRQLWWKRLIGDEGASRRFSTWQGQLDEPNQRVIRADVERTKADMEYFRQPNVRDKMEMMLTCWCKMERTKYKQGLNEVLAPFLYLQVPLDEAAPLKDDEVFDLFAAFVRDYAPFFSSEDFVPLQSAFVLFRRLLLYHRPQLQKVLSQKGVTPDMFCMPWFLTLYASKTPMKLTMSLWDRLLERGEADFFLFLALAVVLSASEAILTAERSQLPEVLTALGVASRPELEATWALAEELRRQTPCTFSGRVRRRVLKPERQDSLEELEREGVFYIVKEELVGHCYPARPGEVLKLWQPPASCTWRLLLLDLRPLKDFEASRLPAAVHFDVAQRFPQTSWSGRKLPWAKEQVAPEPEAVMEALKDTLGEAWLQDEQAHICLLARKEDGWLLRQVSQLLCLRLCVRHVSVAAGGHEALMRCAAQQGYDLVQAPRPRIQLAAGLVASGAQGAAQRFSSGVQKVMQNFQQQVEAKAQQAPTVYEGSPELIDRPGNWSSGYDMSLLEAVEELGQASWCCGDCVALVVRDGGGGAEAWRGCRCSLALQGGQVLCCAAGRLLKRISVHRVTKVSKKARMPQTVHVLVTGQEEPQLVVYFEDQEKVLSFGKAFNRERAPRPVRPLAPPTAALSAVAQNLQKDAPEPCADEAPAPEAPEAP